MAKKSMGMSKGMSTRNTMTKRMGGGGVRNVMASGSKKSGSKGGMRRWAIKATNNAYLCSPDERVLVDKKQGSR